MKLLLLIPVIGTILLSAVPFRTQSDKARGKQIALITSILTFIQSIVIYMGMEEGTSLFKVL
jgi:NADH:ubiquinone oxidoreductase subunit 4 (subunit M)